MTPWNSPSTPCKDGTHGTRFYSSENSRRLWLFPGSLRGFSRKTPGIGNASLFTKILFTIFVPINPPPPNQQNEGFPLEFLLEGPQTELRTLSQNCEQTLQKLRTKRIMNKRAFLRESPGKLLEKFPRIAKCYKFQDLGHWERQTCREPWVHTAGTLSPPSVRDVF